MPGASVIGIAGLGLVGSALANRLTAAGRIVLGFDTDPARGVLLDAARRGSSRGSIAQLAADADCLMIAVFDDAQLRAVTAALIATPERRVSLVVCITTALPATLLECGGQCSNAGIAFVEAPISGSSAKIAAGEGRMFVGGSPDDIDGATPILADITQHRKVIGPLGQASAAKLSTNLVLGLNRLALAEGMALAESLGIERSRYLDLLLDSAATSRAAQEKGPMMVADHYEPPVATIAQHAKDVGLMLELGRQTGQPLPMSELHRDLLAQSIARGDTQLDNAAVIRTLRALRTS
jgi:3-hydroxyisobutyrate dehydrogenase-like beta-hydroxyacid dehydrogenase